MKRRDFMLAGTAIGAGLATANMAFADSPNEDEAEDFTAEQALQRLMDGNRRFVSGKSEHPRMTENWPKRLSKGQEPFKAILTIPQPSAFTALAKECDGDCPCS